MLKNRKRDVVWVDVADEPRSNINAVHARRCGCLIVLISGTPGGLGVVGVSTANAGPVQMPVDHGGKTGEWWSLVLKLEDGRSGNEPQVDFDHVTCSW